MDLQAHDDRESYCRTLGHHVPFRYCRGMANGLPCRLVADCWYTQFDAAGWLREHFTREQVAQITSPPKPKMATLLDLIAKAQNRDH